MRSLTWHVAYTARRFPVASQRSSTHDMEVHLHGILAQEGGPLEVLFASTETTYLWVIFGISLLALAFAYYLVREVLAAPEGTEKMKEIARAIQEGAKAYLSRQFRTVGIFLALLTVLLFFILPAPENAVALGVLDQVRTVARLHPGRRVQRAHRVRRDVARGPRERPDRERGA